MVRRILLAAAALLVAGPLAAQEDFVWSSDRPDGHAPLDIRGARVLDVGTFQVSYRFSKVDDRGIWFDNDSIPLSTVFGFGYDVVPLTQESLNHEVEVAFGLTEDLTLMGSLRYLQLERLQQPAGAQPYLTDTDGLGDAEVSALYSLYRQGPYTANLRGGLLIPVGDDAGPTDQPPFGYDMRPGAGVFAALPGMTAQMQNEFGSVGAQVDGRIYFGTNDSGFTPGDRLSVTGWAAYRLNASFSASARLAYETWNRVEGFDPALDPFLDPSYDGFFSEGSLLTIPVGINFLMPEDSPFAGHRLSLEYIHPIDQSFEGPQLGFSQGLVVGWQMVW